MPSSRFIHDSVAAVVERVRPRRSLTRAARALTWAGYLALSACSADTTIERGDPSDIRADELGDVQFRLDASKYQIVGGVRYQITSPNHPAIMGAMLPEPGGKFLTATVELAADRGYLLLVAAYRENGEQTCMVDATFDVFAGATSRVDLTLECETVIVPVPSGAAVSDGGLPDGATATHQDAGRDGAVDAGAKQPDMDGQVRSDGAAAPVDGGKPPSADARADGAESPDRPAEGDDASAPSEDASAPADDGSLAGEDASAQREVDSGLAAQDSGVVSGDGGSADAGSPRDGAAARDGGRAPIDRMACSICSARECARPRGVDRGRDCVSAGGSVNAGPGAGAPRAAVCQAALDCAHDTSCSLRSSLDCYCGPGQPAQACRAGGPVGECRAQFEAAAQSSDRSRVVDSFSNDGTLAHAASRVLQCEAESCRLACFGAP